MSQTEQLDEQTGEALDQIFNYGEFRDLLEFALSEHYLRDEQEIEDVLEMVDNLVLSNRDQFFATPEPVNTEVNRVRWDDDQTMLAYLANGDVETLKAVDRVPAEHVPDVDD